MGPDKYEGTNGYPCYVAIKVPLAHPYSYCDFSLIQGQVFDVSGKDAYLPGGSYSGMYLLSSVLFPEAISHLTQALSLRRA
jgi:hypothetical protein